MGRPDHAQPKQAGQLALRGVQVQRRAAQRSGKVLLLNCACLRSVAPVWLRNAFVGACAGVCARVCSCVRFVSSMCVSCCRQGTQDAPRLCAAANCVHPVHALPHTVTHTVCTRDGAFAHFKSFAQFEFNRIICRTVKHRGPFFHKTSHTPYATQSHVRLLPQIPWPEPLVASRQAPAPCGALPPCMSAHAHTALCTHPFKKNCLARGRPASA